LEFNRGLAVRCIRAWVESQTFPRADYEIFVAASESHDPEELKVIRELLRPQDKLVQFSACHDMDLVAAAADLVAGDALVFTESHCLPETDFLEAAQRTLDLHPQWGGFSGRSLPLTHNLLSVVEAEFYDAGITYNLTQHEWLKVLDQCFVIRREDYRTAGGIDPGYGHFGEWHFAARLRLKGIKIGYAPEVKVGHYYAGDLADLKTFTLDFGVGEMRCAYNVNTDPCSRLFEPPLEWKHRFRWNRTLVDALFRAVETQPTSFRSLIKLLDWRLFSLRRVILVTQAKLAAIHGVLSMVLLVRWKAAAKILFQAWAMTCVRLGCLKFLAGLCPPSYDQDLSWASWANEWTPAIAATWANVGFHELEHFHGSPFRWSEPIACVRLPLGPGAWRITLHLLPCVSRDLAAASIFFVNGRRCRAEASASAETGVDIISAHSADAHVDLAWICEKFVAPKDRRQLGLPVTKIQWHALGAGERIGA
jgi:hypothetical protein